MYKILELSGHAVNEDSS